MPIFARPSVIVAGLLHLVAVIAVALMREAQWRRRERLLIVQFFFVSVAW